MAKNAAAAKPNWTEADNIAIANTMDRIGDRYFDQAAAANKEFDEALKVYVEAELAFRTNPRAAEVHEKLMQWTKATPEERAALTAGGYTYNDFIAMTHEISDLRAAVSEARSEVFAAKNAAIEAMTDQSHEYMKAGYITGRLSGFRLGLQSARLIRESRLPDIPGAEGPELVILAASAMADDADAELLIGALLGADTEE